MQTNIFAYTAPGGSYPEYVSLNRQDDGRITLDVRGPVDADGKCSETIRVTLPTNEMAMLGKAIIDACHTGDIK